MKTYLYVHANTGLTMVANKPPAYRGKDLVATTFGFANWDNEAPVSEMFKGYDDTSFNETHVAASYFQKLVRPSREDYKQGYFYEYIGLVTP